MTSASIVHQLAEARRPVSERSQLIHGDLTANVLFAPSLPPLIIDLSPYWRAARYASAIVIADALIAGTTAAASIPSFADDETFPQYLVRALIFRALSERDSVEVDSTYSEAARVALALAQ